MLRTEPFAAPPLVCRPRVVVIDDHEIVARGLVRVIQHDGRADVLGTAATVAEGAELCHGMEPDLVILDLKLPDSSGLSAITAIKAHCPHAKVIVFTSFAHAKQDALQLGADVFLSKDMPVESISEAMSSLFPSLGSNHPAHRLSEKQRKVAQLVSLGMTNQEVAHALCLSPNTVKTHLKEVLAKLDLRDRVQLAHYWRESEF